MKSKSNETQLERETARQVSILRKNSIWLDGGRDTEWDVVYQESAPRDLASLEGHLWRKESDGSEGEVGELFHAKLALRAAWSNWEYQCDIDATKRLDPKQPQDSHLHTIAQAEAVIIVLEAEIKEIKERIEKLQDQGNELSKQDIKRRRWKGVYKTALKEPDNPSSSEQIIIEMDGRAVIQKRGKPVFKDTGGDVAAYREECKKRGREKNMKIRQREEKVNRLQAEIHKVRSAGI